MLVKNLVGAFRFVRTSNQYRRLALLLVIAVIASWPIAANAQVDVLPMPTIGMDNQYVYPHTSLPGATGIDFSFVGAFAPHYPPEESHTVVIVFEWGPTATGPWSTSPDNVNMVPGGMTDFFGTGIYHGPDDAPFVAIHFYAGGLMTVSGEFAHISVVPEPSAIVFAAVGLMMSLPWARRQRRATAA
jgi:hypothetical protein